MTSEYADTSTAMRPRTVRLPDDLAEQVARAAKAEDRSFSAEIRRAVRRHLSADQKEPR